MWGICPGHQLLCRAVGLDTFKLPFGHHGRNYPVKDLHTGRVEITSQNHGFAAVGPGGTHTIDRDEPVRWETDFGAAALWHVNLYDRRVEGLELLDAPGGTVQYHPEAGPGPHDSLYLFDRFLTRISASRKRPAGERGRSNQGGGAGGPAGLMIIAAAQRHPQDPHLARPDRGLPGSGVRLLRRAGLKGAPGGGRSGSQ